METMKRLSAGQHKAGAAGAARPHLQPEPGGQDFDAQLPTRRELLRVRTRNTMRLSGIPESWIEPQVWAEPQGGRTFLHLRLVVRHWDERLLRYAVAFQTQLMTEIERIDPQARQWLVSIVWCFPHDISCPFPELPQPSEWLDAKALEVDAVESDLAQLFALRDAELLRSDTR